MRWDFWSFPLVTFWLFSPVTEWLKSPGTNNGLIDFNWQRGRIINWVRAMCPPEYPGAFYFHNAKKIIVSKAEFSDLGFREDVKNGSVLLEIDDYKIIKVPNGAIMLRTWSIN